MQLYPYQEEMIRRIVEAVRQPEWMRRIPESEPPARVAGMTIPEIVQLKYRLDKAEADYRAMVSKWEADLKRYEGNSAQLERALEIAARAHDLTAAKLRAAEQKLAAADHRGDAWRDSFQALRAELRKLVTP